MANPPSYSKQRDYSYSVILFLDDRNRKDSDRFFGWTGCKLATVSERDEFIGIATKPYRNCCKKI
jgi:hypothetical protein